MTGTARLVIDALRLDRWTRAEVERRAERGIELGIGGFVLFGGTAAYVASLTARLVRDAGRPLWFAADLERGAGQQFRGLSELPPPASFGFYDDPEQAARRAGRVTGLEAASIGINWVLAPVLDLDMERRNPIVATRSFGADPDVVARLASAWIDGCQSAGVYACAKHFPGHGRTRDDSHIGLPVVAASADELEADLRPFRRVAPAVRTMMVAHVAFPTLGGEGPATTERAIIHGLLRGALAFRGPVATDAMIMGAIDDDAEAAARAIDAGCDLILYPRDAARTVVALDAARDGAHGDRVENALERVDRALASLVGSIPDRSPPSDRPNEAFDRALTPDEEVAFAVRAIVGDPSSFSEWRRDVSTRVVDVSDDPEVGPPAGRDGPLAAILRDALRSAGWHVPERGTGAGGPPPDGAGSAQTIVVLAATPRGWKGHVGLSDEARGRVTTARGGSERSAVVLLGHVRDADALAGPVVCAWSTESIMERAAARWLDEALPTGGDP